MRSIFLIGFILTTLASFGQVDSFSLKTAMANLDQALLNKDEIKLSQLLHKEVTFGHSNGWVQNKSDVIWDLQSGKLVYTKIENTSSTIVAFNPQWATVRLNVNADGSIDGKPFQLKLHALQVWLMTRNGWQLLARQSTKL